MHILKELRLQSGESINLNVIGVTKQDFVTRSMPRRTFAHLASDFLLLTEMFWTNQALFTILKLSLHQTTGGRNFNLFHMMPISAHTGALR
eukprot:1153252-Pelagomonas_calceolata.AAC.1